MDHNDVTAERPHCERKITLKAAVMTCWPRDLSETIDAIRTIRAGHIEVLFPHRESHLSARSTWKVIRQHGKRIVYPNDQLRRKMSDGNLEIQSVPALPIVIAMYKPSGYVVTKRFPFSLDRIDTSSDCYENDEERNQNCSDLSVYDLLTTTCFHDPTFPSDVHPFLPQFRAVGRLDKDTEGLLLFTNHGRWITALTTPASRVGIPKAYRCWLLRPVTDEDILCWINGCIQYRHRNAEHGMKTSLPALSAEFVNATNRYVVDVTIMEGKYRQIRRCWEALSNKVVRLLRLSFGPISLHHELTEQPGQCRIVSTPELHSMETCVQNWYRASP